jgi:hypothetical protein
MPALVHKLNYTYAEYLGFEASSNVKHEFLDGQIYAMAGGTPEHAALAAAALNSAAASAVPTIQISVFVLRETSQPEHAPILPETKISSVSKTAAARRRERKTAAWQEAAKK